MYFYRTLITQTFKRRFSVKTVLCEKFGFTPEQASYILDRINDLNNVSGNLIGAGNKKKLEAHVKQNGQFEGLDDVLQVHGLGPKSVKRICDKLISVKGDREGTELIEPVETTRRFRLPAITPPLSESQASIIKTVGSVSIGSNEISWAKINCISKNLEAWDSTSLESYLTLKRLDLISLITMSKDLVEGLPVCDTYVLEDMNITGFSGSSAGGLPKTILTSIISTLLHQPPTGGVPRVVLVGGRAVARWSGRLVGSERVSSQSLIADIIIKLDGSSLGSGNGAAHLPVLYAEPALRTAYLSSQPATKEVLADSVLLGLAFIDLAMRRRQFMFQPNR